MPVYNGAKFIRQTLDSILAQTFTDFELIISDNGSTDGTDTICSEYAQSDNRIRYYPNSVNRGAAWNYNRVFELARGIYFKWAAHDDLLAAQPELHGLVVDEPGGRVDHALAHGDPLPVIGEFDDVQVGRR